MNSEIPFTQFAGNIKQLDTNFNFPAMKQYYEACFSEFVDIDAMYATLKREGVNFIVSAAGIQINFGFRPRRFAGGPGLPPGQYFTVCANDSFDDRGTLRDEFTAYFSSSSGITATIYDPNIDTSILDSLRQRPDFDNSYPFYLIMYQIEQRTPKSAPLF